MYDVKQLSNPKFVMNDRIKIRILNFNFMVTRFLWIKVEKPVGSLMEKHEFVI